MKNWKSIGKKFFMLPLWLFFILLLTSTIALVLVFTKGWTTLPIAYVVYVFSFYTLTVVCVACFKLLPIYYKNIKENLYKHKYANLYLTNVAYKTHINLYASLSIHVLYIATNAVSAVIYRTCWFAIFSIYYGIMAMMHFLLVRYMEKNNIGENRFGELKRARICAFILLTVNLTLSGVVLMMVYHNRGFQYQGYLIYVIALYTFYATTAAIVNLVKYRKYRSPIISISKIIKLAASLFSMLFLETAMFSQFGEDTPLETKRIMIMATGAGISVVVVGMSFYMIVRSSKEMKEIEKEK